MTVLHAVLNALSVLKKSQHKRLMQTGSNPTNPTFVYLLHIKTQLHQSLLGVAGVGGEDDKPLAFTPAVEWLLCDFPPLLLSGFDPGCRTFTPRIICKYIYIHLLI